MRAPGWKATIATAAMSLVLVLVLAQPPASWASSRVYRVALLISHNSSGGRTKRLYYAVSDAQKMQGVLHQLAGYPLQNIFLVANQDARKVKEAFAKVKRFIRKLRRKAGPQSKVTLLVYYSGHARQSQFYLGKSSLSFEEMRSFLKSSGASLRLAFLDTCGSGRFLRLRGLVRRDRGFRIPALHSHTTKGEAIITSTGDRENTYEDLRLRGGIFTHYMVTGLRGAADSDGDGRITLNELYTYTYNGTLNRTVFAHAGPQKPHFHTNLRGSGHVILSQTRRKGATLHFHPKLHGHFFIWDVKKHLYAGFQKKANTSLYLAMATGRYVVQWRHKKRVFTANITLQQRQTYHLGRKHKQLALATGQLRRGGNGTNTQTWTLLENQRPPSPWSLFLQTGVGSAALAGGTVLGGGALGLRHRFFALRLGFWGTSVRFPTVERGQLLMELRAEVGYGHTWGRFSLFGGLYAGLGLLVQDVKSDPQAGPILQVGGTLAPGFWLSRRWGLALQLNAGADMGQFGKRWQFFFHWSTALSLRYRL